uniref:Uncharacterized protein n=1 Tax=Parascaris univalens TaxID=6257 RepID=A0A915AUJ6_PARUN
MECGMVEGSSVICSMSDVSRRTDKRARSEAQRLESCMQRRQLETRRQAIISRALNGVDSIATSKKIVFHSDSEGECIEEASIEKKARGIPLFDDEEDGDIEDIEPSISNRHFGSKGAKLMLMETKFGNDERFRLSEKFLEDGDQDEEGDEEVEAGKERRATLAILSKVLGKSIRTTKSTGSGIHFKRAAPFSRFDPDDEDHLQWLNERKQHNKPQGSSEREGKGHEGKDCQRIGRGDEERRKVEESTVVGGYYFEVDKNFAESLKKKLNVEDSSSEPINGFSFLGSIGRNQSVEDGGLEEKLMGSSKKHPVYSKEVSVRGMDEEHRSEEGRPEKKLKRAEGLSTAPDSGCFLFVTHSDHDIWKVVDNFRRKRSVEAIGKRWSYIRTSIIKVYKGQRKQALKRQKERRTQTLRREYLSLREDKSAHGEAQNGTYGVDEGEKKSSREKRSPLRAAIRLEKKTDGRSKRKKRRVECEVNAANA